MRRQLLTPRNVLIYGVNLTLPLRCDLFDNVAVVKHRNRIVPMQDRPFVDFCCNQAFALRTQIVSDMAILRQQSQGYAS